MMLVPFCSGNGKEYTASVMDMALRREKRAEEQLLMLEHFNLPIVCVTMNIAGPIKRTRLIDQAFIYAVKLIRWRLCAEGRYETIEWQSSTSERPAFPIMKTVFCFEKTGCEAMMAVDMDAKRVKACMQAIEDGSELGRLFDIDVINTDGIKLGRDLPRKCLICDETAAVCARSRAHSVEQLQRCTHELIVNALSDRIAEIAEIALHTEVHTTPKPGLVDERNNGANSDMDIALFERSIAAIKPFFKKMALTALSPCFIEIKKIKCSKNVSANNDTSSISFINYNTLMTELRLIGMEAEKAMLAATGGINTHRGAIYSLGLISAAYALALGCDDPAIYGQIPPNVDPITSKAPRLQSSAMADSNQCTEFNIVERCLIIASKLAASTNYNDFSTNGAKVREKYGISGAAEQARAGFPMAVLAKELKEEYDALAKIGHRQTDTVNGWAYALIGIMAELDDNNAFKRGGREGAEFVKKRASELLSSKKVLELNELERFDDELISRNISCGGAADMLGTAVMLSLIETDCKID